ncbi:MAG: response regulator [Planctomycetales bacterium]|nr:response regulator [Planctomycetales bacterium]
MTLPTVCFVEDSDLDFELGCVALLEVAPDAKVLRATSCRDGALAVLEHRPLLVFLDLNLPCCNGLEVIREVMESTTADQGPLPVFVVFTTSTNPVDRERAFAAGAADFLTKPTNPQRYLASVESVARTWLPIAN